MGRGIPLTGEMTCAGSISPLRPKPEILGRPGRLYRPYRMGGSAEVTSTGAARINVHPEDVMVNWWAEEWSFGSGRSRVSCGISRTEEGYAVQVFRGDSCVESFVYPSRAEAAEVAHALKLHFQVGSRSADRTCR